MGLFETLERLTEQLRNRRMPKMSEPGHALISGATRSGKSFWVLGGILNSVANGDPLCYIDPKGDTYRTLQAILTGTGPGQELWKARRDKILFINPVAYSDYIVGFNAIEPMGDFAYARPDLVALLSNSIVSHIRRQSGFELAEANRMQNIMSAAIGTLVEGGESMTLAELPLLFVPADKAKDGKISPFNPFTARLLNGGVKHHGTRTFWENQWATWTPQARREWVQSTEGRIFQYLFDDRMMMTVCTSQNSCIDFNRIVNEGWWVFVNLPYPLLSETISTVLGNLIISKIFYACMQRPMGAVPYRLVLDEAKFFNTGPLEMILETSGAYNLWLTMVVQSLDQMCRVHSGGIDERLRETALNNVRYFSVFNNTTDNETFARLMFPVTGQVVAGQRQSGDYEYLPVQAEISEHERRFSELKRRQVVLYDRFDDAEPRAWKTPTIEFTQVEQSKIELFESEHLHLTGKPAAEIRREIEERQEWCKTLSGSEPPKPDIPTAPVGRGMP
jgi:hypothetical protein